MAIAAVAGQAGKAVASPGASASRAFGSNVAVGSMVTVYGITFKTGSDPLVAGDVTKSAGTATIGTISLDAQKEIVDGADSIQAGIWSCLVTGAGSLTMSLATGSASNYGIIITNEYTGSFDASRVEATNTGGSAINGQTSASGGNVTTAGAGMIAGALAVNTTANPLTMTQDATFTEVATETNGAVNMVGEAIHKIVGSGTTDDASWTIGGSNAGWAAVSVAYKEAAAGGALTGTSSIVFTTSGALTGSGALSGSSALTFSQAGSLSGSGALSGAVALAFSPTATLSGDGALTGTATVTFDVSGTLEDASGNSGALTGSTAVSFTAVGSLTGTGDLTGFTSLTFSASGSFTNPVAAEQPSGGFFFGFDRYRSERDRRRREQEEREREAEAIEDETTRQIAELLRVQEAKDAKRADLERLQALADRYAGEPLGLPARTRAALYNAYETRTLNALEQMQREIERMLEEEEAAISAILMLDD